MTAASFAQERAWLASRFAAGTALYHVADQWPLHGDLSERQIRAALAAVVARHEPLRTGFRVVDGVLTAVVHDRVDPDVEVVDLSGRPEERRREDREALADRLKHTAFDLSRAPLWRAGLVRLGAGRWRLLFVAHHAVCDAPSLFNLHAEIAEFCAAFEQDRTPHVPQLHVSYGDYARQQRDRLGGDGIAPLAGYWREQLAGLPPAHGLPLDLPRPARRSFAGAELRAALPASTARALAAAGRSGATPFELLLAGYAALVHRRSGRDDLVLGVPLSGRDRPELLPLVGTFVNTVALRVDSSGDPSYAALVDRVQAVWRAARDHQEMPFQAVVEQLAPQRGPGLPPLYQLAFNVTAAEGFGPPSTAAEDDLLLEVSGAAVRLEYNTALFGRETAAGLLADYAAVLTAALADPATPLSRLPAGPGPGRPGAAPAPLPGRVPPRTAAEALVARAWAEVLGVDRVGVDDDFFAAGGHSLQALRLLARLSSDHGVETTVDAFFANPTVAGLAAVLDRRTTPHRHEQNDPEGETWQ